MLALLLALAVEPIPVTTIKAAPYTTAIEPVPASPMPAWAAGRLYTSKHAKVTIRGHAYTTKGELAGALTFRLTFTGL